MTIRAYRRPRVFPTTIAVLLAFIPAYIWILVFVSLSPEGFWQKFVLFGAGIYLLGGLQLFFLAALFLFLLVVWKD